MPPKPFVDPASLDFNKLLATREDILKVNPHRFEFALLDGVLSIDRDQYLIVGYRDVKADEFWVRGHIPGRPLFPGVLMVETSAQLVSYYAVSENMGNGFLGFGAADAIKFRGEVVPGQRLVMMGKMVELKSRRIVGDTQGFVDGKMVYEGRITGMWL